MRGENHEPFTSQTVEAHSQREREKRINGSCLKGCACGKWYLSEAPWVRYRDTITNTPAIAFDFLTAYHIPKRTVLNLEYVSIFLIHQSFEIF